MQNNSLKNKENFVRFLHRDKPTFSPSIHIIDYCLQNKIWRFDYVPLSSNSIRFPGNIACAASVSVRLSARLMHFSLFWPRENWGGRKKVRGGGGERREGFLFSPPLPLPAASISVALAPIFAQPKSEIRLQRAESSTETLATQAILSLRSVFPA